MSAAAQYARGPYSPKPAGYRAPWYKAERNARILDLADSGLTGREVATALELSIGVVAGVLFRAGGKL